MNHLGLLLLVCTLACGEEVPMDAPLPIPDAQVSDVLLSGDTPDAGEPDGGSESAFRLVRQGPIGCPLTEMQCTNWPAGQVIRYESEERFEGNTLERTFYVLIPEGVSANAPVWVQLHGGYGSAIRTLITFEGVGLAEGEVHWERNVEGCHFDPYQAPTTYRNDDGAECAPEAVSAQANEPMLFVFPEGITNADGIRHWEDGRVPSPGFGTPEQNRDDVGFLDHVLETVVAEAGLYEADPERLYLSGISNGGKMTTRVFCSMGPSYPSLSKLAALGIIVSTLAEGLSEGLEGRPVCDGAQVPVPVLYIAGRGFDTPDATVDGDGFVPWGEPGGRYLNRSPTAGWVLGVDDTLTALRERLETSTTQRLVENRDTVGFFTERREWSSDETDVRLVFLGTDGGAHQNSGTRYDMNPAIRTWAFMSAFRRTQSGVVRGTSAVNGEY